MSQTQRLGLSHVAEISQIGNMPDLTEQLSFAVALEIFFELD